MEEEFEKKSGNKFLKILIPIIILILLIGAGVGYYFIINTPKYIFSKTIDGVFESVEAEEYDTLKTNIELSMSIESDDSDIQSVGQIVNSVKLKTNQEIDLNNKVVNEAISASFLGQDLLNIEYIIKDETSYMFLKDIFSKYIEVPLSEIGYEENIFAMMEELEKITDKDILAETNKIIKTELKDKRYEQKKEEIIINGEKVETTKSTLILTPKEATDVLANVLNNIKENEKILGNFKDKEEIKQTMQEIVDEINKTSKESVTENGEKIEISIYTKGIKNEFVRFDIDLGDNDQVMGLYTTKVSENNYSISVVQDEVELFDISVINQKKNEKSGTITIKFDMSEIMKQEGAGINTLALSINAKYNVEYNAKVEVPEITDSVKYDEMTEEDSIEMYENLQKTELYTLIEQSGFLDTSDLYEATNIDETMEVVELEPKVTAEGHTVEYSVPASFTSSIYNTEDNKYYSDENFNSISIRIEKETKQNYLDLLKESYALTDDLYEEQEISGIKTLKVGDKEFSYRTITYNYYGNKIIDSYYCYEIEEGILYIVETSIQEGTVAAEELNKLLEIKL